MYVDKTIFDVTKKQRDAFRHVLKYFSSAGCGAAPGLAGIGAGGAPGLAGLGTLPGLAGIGAGGAPGLAGIGAGAAPGPGG